MGGFALNCPSEWVYAANVKTLSEGPSKQALNWRMYIYRVMRSAFNSEILIIKANYKMKNDTTSSDKKELLKLSLISKNKSAERSTPWPPFVNLTQNRDDGHSCSEVFPDFQIFPVLITKELTLC